MSKQFMDDWKWWTMAYIQNIHNFINVVIPKAQIIWSTASILLLVYEVEAYPKAVFLKREIVQFYKSFTLAKQLSQYSYSIQKNFQ